MTELTQEQLAEIRSTLDLIEADNNSPVIHINDATINWMVEKFRDALNHIDAQAARIAEREKPCVWTPEGEDSSSWNTGCGSSFWFDDGHEGVNFCPFCGHPAVFDHEGDEA